MIENSHPDTLREDPERVRNIWRLEYTDEVDEEWLNPLPGSWVTNIRRQPFSGVDSVGNITVTHEQIVRRPAPLDLHSLWTNS